LRFVAVRHRCGQNIWRDPRIGGISTILETAPLRRFNYSPLRDGHGEIVDQRYSYMYYVYRVCCSNQVIWSFFRIPISTSRSTRPHIRRQHKTERVVQRLFMLACAHSDSHASNSGVFSSRHVQSGNCVSLATGVQWLVIAVDMPRVADCLPWL
jgi:hypothetical protein